MCMYVLHRVIFRSTICWIKLHPRFYCCITKLPYKTTAIYLLMILWVGNLGRAQVAWFISAPHSTWSWQNMEQGCIFMLLVGWLGNWLFLDVLSIPSGLWLQGAATPGKAGPLLISLWCLFLKKVSSDLFIKL